MSQCTIHICCKYFVQKNLLFGICYTKLFTNVKLIDFVCARITIDRVVKKFMNILTHALLTAFWPQISHDSISAKFSFSRVLSQISYVIDDLHMSAQANFFLGKSRLSGQHMRWCGQARNVPYRSMLCAQMNNGPGKMFQSGILKLRTHKIAHER